MQRASKYYCIDCLISNKIYLFFQDLNSINIFQKFKNIMKKKTNLYTENQYKLYSIVVEFINDIHLQSLTALIIISYQSLIMLTDQLQNVNTNSIFLKYIQYFGILQIIRDTILIQNNNGIKIIIVLYAFLLLIIITFIGLMIYVWIKDKNEDDFSLDLLKIFQKSIFMQILRLFLVIYQYLYLPISTSISIFIIKHTNDISEILAIILLIITPLFHMIIEYHQLEIQLDVNIQYSLVHTNLSSNIFDVILVYIYEVLINLSTSNVALGISICIFLIRIILSYSSPCYNQKMRKVHNFLQWSSLIITSSMVAGLNTQQTIILIGISAVLIIFCFYIIFGTKNMNYFKLRSTPYTKLQQCKLDLVRKGTFSYAYRQLLFLQRQNTNYREYLLIQILKKKCFKAETNSRGGTKVINTEDLLDYEKNFFNVISNLLVIANHSVSILKFMQIKQPKCEIFIQQIQYVVDIIQQTKILISDMFKANAKSADTIQLARIFCQYIINDQQFIKKIQDMARQQIQSLIQKKQRKKLFNQKSGVIFISLLEQIGKITKVSKNMKAVLGYSSYDLNGLSINQIMPFSIRPFHEDTLLNFLQKYNKRTFKTDPYIRFYAYNKGFHLQQVIINYYFSMGNFQNFQLSGLFKQVNQTESIIITDYLGNIQGWTADLGDSFKLDTYSMLDCRQYNIFLFLPSLIKYLDKPEGSKVEIQTLYFFCKNLKSSKLKIYESNYKKQQNTIQIMKKQIKMFNDILVSGQYNQIRLVTLTMQTVVFCKGLVKFRKFNIRKIQPIKNYIEVMQIIRSPDNSTNKQEEPLSYKISNIQYSHQIQQQKQTYKSFTDSQKTAKNKFQTDFNFTLDKNFQTTLNIESIILYNSQDKLDSVYQLSGKDYMVQQTKQNSSHTIISTKTKPSSNFTPSLEGANYNKLFYPLSVIFIILIIYDEVVLKNFQETMNNQCNNVYKRNYAFMIFAKSAFNPNLTYINTFSDGNLMQNTNYLQNQFTDFKTQQNITVSMSKFYLFNIQIPSTLDKLVLTNNFTEIANNFNNIINEYDQRIIVSNNNWIKRVEQLKLDSTVRFAFICLESLFYVLYLIYIYLQSRKQNKVVQAFFKFQKADLEQKIKKIKESITLIQLKCQQWYLQRQFNTFAKQKGLCNLDLKSSVQGNQQKIIFDITPQRQNSIMKKKMISLIAFITLFLIGQVTFLIAYGILSTNLINIYKRIPEALDSSYKLIVAPNLQISSLFFPLNKSIITKYHELNENTLSNPQQEIPNLFPLLETIPCFNCTFLYPLLTTNYRSFYSSFDYIINQKQINNNTNITELFYGLDIVTKNIKKSLNIRSIPNVTSTIILYLVSIIIFIVAGYYGYNRIRKQTNRLQIFLKYFDDEILMKNKHMNNIVKKTI